MKASTVHWHASATTATARKARFNFGLLCDVRGRPAAVTVYPGNVGDSRTILPEVVRLRQRFGLSRIVLVGDRGMIVQTTINALRKLDGIDWISALKGNRVAKLMRENALEPLDERNLFELIHPDFGERLVACRNSGLAVHRARTRQSLLEATEAELAKLQSSVARGRLTGAAKIGLSVGEVINRYRMKKHFRIEITDRQLDFARCQDKIAAEEALDGIYVIRTSLAGSDMAAEDCVRSYKTLRAGIPHDQDRGVRPVTTAVRVRAHVHAGLVCRMAYARSSGPPAVLRHRTGTVSAAAGCKRSVAAEPRHRPEYSMTARRCIVFAL